MAERREASFRLHVPRIRSAHVRVAVVGHTEWIRFARVDRVPEAGGIAHSIEAWEGAGGGGAVAAAQVAKLAGTCDFFTAVGDDDLGRRSVEELSAQGVHVRAATRAAPTRSALTMVDDAGERTIVTLGDRLEPRAEDPLPWELLDRADGVFVTAGDPAAVRRARGARVLVVTSRVLVLLAESDVRADVVIGSERDPAERFDPDVLREQPAIVVRTQGRGGGSWSTDDGRHGRYQSAPLPGPVVDTYGAGDSFQAGLTYGLATGIDIDEALALAAACGAHAVTGRGPTGGQLTAAELDER